MTVGVVTGVDFGVDVAVDVGVDVGVEIAVDVGVDVVVDVVQDAKTRDVTMRQVNKIPIALLFIRTPLGLLIRDFRKFTGKSFL